MDPRHLCEWTRIAGTGTGLTVRGSKDVQSLDGRGEETREQELWQVEDTIEYLPAWIREEKGDKRWNRVSPVNGWKVVAPNARSEEWLLGL